jgi:hypothetical protein
METPILLSKGFALLVAPDLLNSLFALSEALIAVVL